MVYPSNQFPGAQGDVEIMFCHYRFFGRATGYSSVGRGPPRRRDLWPVEGVVRLTLKYWRALPYEMLMGSQLARPGGGFDLDHLLIHAAQTLVELAISSDYDWCRMRTENGKLDPSLQRVVSHFNRLKPEPLVKGKEAVWHVSVRNFPGRGDYVNLFTLPSGYHYEQFLSDELEGFEENGLEYGTTVAQYVMKAFVMKRMDFPRPSNQEESVYRKLVTETSGLADSMTAFMGGLGVREELAKVYLATDEQNALADRSWDETYQGILSLVGFSGITQGHHLVHRPASKRTWDEILHDFLRKDSLVSIINSYIAVLKLKKGPAADSVKAFNQLLTTRKAAVAAGTPGNPKAGGDWFIHYQVLADTDPANLSAQAIDVVFLANLKDNIIHFGGPMPHENEAGKQNENIVNMVINAFNTGLGGCLPLPKDQWHVPATLSCLTNTLHKAVGRKMKNMGVNDKLCKVIWASDTDSRRVIAALSDFLKTDSFEDPMMLRTVYLPGRLHLCEHREFFDDEKAVKLEELNDLIHGPPKKIKPKKKAAAAVKNVNVATPEVVTQSDGDLQVAESAAVEATETAQDVVAVVDPEPSVAAAVKPTEEDKPEDELEEEPENPVAAPDAEAPLTGKERKHARKKEKRRLERAAAAAAAAAAKEQEDMEKENKQEEIIEAPEPVEDQKPVEAPEPKPTVTESKDTNGKKLDPEDDPNHKAYIEPPHDPNNASEMFRYTLLRDQQKYARECREKLFAEQNKVPNIKELIKDINKSFLPKALIPAANRSQPFVNKWHVKEIVERKDGGKTTCAVFLYQVEGKFSHLIDAKEINNADDDDDKTVDAALGMIFDGFLDGIHGKFVIQEKGGGSGPLGDEDGADHGYWRKAHPFVPMLWTVDTESIVEKYTSRMKHWKVSMPTCEVGKGKKELVDACNEAYLDVKAEREGKPRVKPPPPPPPPQKPDVKPQQKKETENGKDSGAPHDWQKNIAKAFGGGGSNKAATKASSGGLAKAQIPNDPQKNAAKGPLPQQQQQKKTGNGDSTKDAPHDWQRLIGKAFNNGGGDSNKSDGGSVKGGGASTKPPPAKGSYTKQPQKVVFAITGRPDKAKAAASTAAGTDWQKTAAMSFFGPAPPKKTDDKKTAPPPAQQQQKPKTTKIPASPTSSSSERFGYAEPDIAYPPGTSLEIQDIIRQQILGKVFLSEAEGGFDIPLHPDVKLMLGENPEITFTPFMRELPRRDARDIAIPYDANGNINLSGYDIHEEGRYVSVGSMVGNENNQQQQQQDKPAEQKEKGGKDSDSFPDLISSYGGSSDGRSLFAVAGGGGGGSKVHGSDDGMPGLLPSEGSDGGGGRRTVTPAVLKKDATPGWQRRKE